MFNAASYLVWMIPALAGLIFIYFFGSRRRKAIAALMGQPQTLLRLIPQESRGLKNKLQACALVFIFIALAGPQWGVELVSTQGRAHQILVAVDVSLSMLAEDVKPKRLEKAKEELSLLLEQLKGSRVGVMAFAGEAAIDCTLVAGPVRDFNLMSRRGAVQASLQVLTLTEARQSLPLAPQTFVYVASGRVFAELNQHGYLLDRQQTLCIDAEAGPVLLSGVQPGSQVLLIAIR